MAFSAIYPGFQHNEQPCKEGDDLEDNESDTTKFSSTIEVFDKTHLLSTRENLNPSTSAFVQRRAAKRAKELNNFWTWLRWGVTIGLQTIIILLLSVPKDKNTTTGDNILDLTVGDKRVETGGDINGLYKTYT